MQFREHRVSPLSTSFYHLSTILLIPPPLFLQRSLYDGASAHAVSRSTAIPSLKGLLGLVVVCKWDNAQSQGGCVICDESLHYTQCLRPTHMLPFSAIAIPSLQGLLGNVTVGSAAITGWSARGIVFPNETSNLPFKRLTHASELPVHLLGDG